MKKPVIFEVCGEDFSYKLTTPIQRRYGSYVLLKGGVPVGYAETEKEVINRLFIIVNKYLLKRKDTLCWELKECNTIIKKLGKRPSSLERFKV
jgi:hypothetical protein